MMAALRVGGVASVLMMTSDEERGNRYHMASGGSKGDDGRDDGGAPAVPSHMLFSRVGGAGGSWCRSLWLTLRDA